jgi:hypothetical protein
MAVKCMIPESIFTGPRGQVDARSWDAALDVVQQSLLGMAVANDVNDEEDRVLTEVFRQCEELRAKEYLEVVPTNRDLAKKYAISPRTVTNWRKEGCPFEDGQWAVLDWMAERRYAPAGANAKFGKQLTERKEKAICSEITGELNEAVAQAAQLKTAYQSQGLKPPEWLRGFRAMPSQSSLSSMSAAKHA